MGDKFERKDTEPKQIDWNELASFWDTFDEARDYTKKTFALLEKQIDLNQLNILDFGCGTGILTEYMAAKAKQIIAIDSAKKMIEVLANKNLKNVKTINNELSQKAINNNPILQGQFDLIVASSVCAFLPNFQEVLALLKSLLKPNGIFVQWDWLPSKREPDFGFTEEMIREHYKEVGLKVESLSIPFHMLEEGEKMEVLMAVGRN